MTKEHQGQVEQLSESTEKGVYVFFDPTQWERVRVSLPLSSIRILSNLWSRAYRKRSFSNTLTWIHGQRVALLVCRDIRWQALWGILCRRCQYGRGQNLDFGKHELGSYGVGHFLDGFTFSLRFA